MSDLPRKKPSARDEAAIRAVEDSKAIVRALKILQGRLKRGTVFGSPQCVKDFLRLQTQGLTHEEFGVMFLDARHRLIQYERLFRGTLTHTVVHPRELLKKVIGLEAASVVLHHNHPSGSCVPSDWDRTLTLRLQTALWLIDVCVIDHVITSDEGAFSMVEQGQLMQMPMDVR
jgi:DNA repair protein RadC